MLVALCRWSDGSIVDYRNWGQGEPNNEGGMELCVGMELRDGPSSHSCLLFRTSLFLLSDWHSFFITRIKGQHLIKLLDYFNN